jgi:hypothetical protein
MFIHNAYNFTLFYFTSNLNWSYMFFEYELIVIYKPNLDSVNQWF